MLGRSVACVVALTGCWFVAPPEPNSSTMHDANGDGQSDAHFDARFYAANVMFVTSAKFPATTITTLVDADKMCNDAAHAAPLDGDFIAWVSLEGQDAATRLGARAHGGWVRPDNLPFANTVVDILRGAIFYPPRITERGADIGRTSDHVATMTTADGNTTFGCGNAGTIYEYGVPDGGTRAWTASMTEPCTNMAHLYCFEVDKPAIDVTPPAPSGKRAFISSMFDLVANQGIGGFNNECVLEGGAGFVAYVATTVVSAKQNAGAIGPRYRYDGVKWTDDLELFIAPLGVDIGGGYVDTGQVWTGASDPNFDAVSAENCNDWSTTNASGVNGIVGDGSRSEIHGFDNGMADCGGSARVYCVEQ